MTPATRKNYPLILPPPPALFSGMFLRWNALNRAEKIVAANIVLIPIWWLVGLTNYVLLFMTLGIVVYEYLHYGTVRLQRPSGIVILLFAFYTYGFVDNFLIWQDAYPSIEVPSELAINFNVLVKTAFAFAIPFLIWYLQSNQIKVRLEVVLWSCTVTIILMLLGWLLFQFALPGISENPPRTLYATLTGKGRFNPDEVNGWSNYLVFIEERTTESRVRFFFDHYQTAAVFLAFTALLAFDLKNRLWSGALITICCFLMGLAAARAVWLAFLPAVFLSFAWNAAKSKVGWLLFAIAALASFIILAIPSVTNEIFHTYTATTEYVGNARAGSTEARSKIYHQTLEQIPNKIIFGHKVPGDRASKGPSVLVDKVPRIGTHSFILGDLLYQKGILGTVIFASFWIWLIIGFFQTKLGRPRGSFLFLLMLTLTSVVSIIHLSMIYCTLLCIIIRQPGQKYPWSHRLCLS